MLGKKEFFITYKNHRKTIETPKGQGPRGYDDATVLSYGEEEYNREHSPWDVSAVLAPDRPDPFQQRRVRIIQKSIKGMRCQV